MILVHHRGFHNLYGIEITMLVKLQIMEINFENKMKVAGSKINILRHQLINPRIQTLLEDDNLDVWNLI